jgi:hypothetical protein
MISGLTKGEYKSTKHLEAKKIEIPEMYKTSVEIGNLGRGGGWTFALDN